MEADFSGYATKAGLKCSDGRTIMPDAFKHQDKTKVPLVWQHGHTDPENVLGHVILENRSDGVYGYGFFNSSTKAEHTRGLLEHGDINSLSIWANDLIERAGRVLHGAIREVSLVLSGANPGAVIENVTIRHSDNDETTLDDEAIIYTGLPLENFEKKKDDRKDTYDSMTNEQKEVVRHMVDEALSHVEMKEDEKETVSHANGGATTTEETVQDVYDSMTDKQKEVLHYLVGEALASAGGSMGQDNLDDNNENNDNSKGKEMKHNVFEQGKEGEKKDRYILSHSDIQAIVADATKTGSLKDAVENFALSHGITDIDLLFPDAQAITTTPELFARRTEWVQNLLNGVRKSPFSRIKTMSADLTVAEARAKGYIKGNLKKEEFFKVSKRVTTPTTIYKKQKLDRDDMSDITDFDVVAWLKGEMRLMLDEEIARAILVGDGRLVSDDDKINEDNIRPIAGDHEVYTTTVNINLADANSSIVELSDAIILERHNMRGTGLPTLYTTESYIAKFMVLKDTTGRRIYSSISEVATALRVQEIVAVEVLEEYPEIVAILVNPVDYVLGADRGGSISMFDDFDIDYNQYKYLIETRASGALTKLKAAMVIKGVAGTDVLVTPAAPTMDDSTHVITVTATTHVKYYNADTDAELTAGAQAALAQGATLNIEARADTGYYIASTDESYWTFTHSD